MLFATAIKSCRVCGAAFEPFLTTQVVCGLACARRVPVLQRKAEKLDRAKTRARLDELRPRRFYIDRAQAAMNRYVHVRDAGKPCISCGEFFEQKRGGTMDSGHYLSRGSSPHLRFHLHNMALQCVRENRYLGGAAGKFRLGLIARIGLAKVEAIEADRSTPKWSIDYLKRLIRVFTKKAKRLEARHALQG